MTRVRRRHRRSTSDASSEKKAGLDQKACGDGRRSYMSSLTRVVSLVHPRYPIWGIAEIVCLGGCTQQSHNKTSYQIHWHRQSINVLSGALPSQGFNAPIAWDIRDLSQLGDTLQLSWSPHRNRLSVRRTRYT